MNNREIDDTAIVERLATIMKEFGLSEASLKRDLGDNGKISVSLRREGLDPHAVQARPAEVAAAAPHATAAPQVEPEVQPPARSNSDGGTEDAGSLSGMVTSPMVGIVYLQPEPGAAPFVKEGDRISAGETIAIIEAMKTMNRVPAPNGGVVRKVLVEDASPVEYGSPLMTIG